MSFVKRIFFFALVNILVMTSVTIVANLIYFALTGQFMPMNTMGGSYSEGGASLLPLVLISGVFGMGGALVSLLMSKWMAKRMMGLTMIDANTRDPQAREVYQMVEAMSRRARLPKIPEVGIYQSPEMNAFATGPSKSNSLVAVSTGLLHHLNRDEVEAVIGHEVAHIANGDMVTLTLIQGVINTFVIFLSRLFANLIASQFKDNRHMIEFALVLVMQIGFSLLGAIVVAYFSRQREYRADSGGARYSNRENMISALKALGRQSLPYDKEDQLAAFKISGAQIGSLFRTHPPLEDRIARLQKAR